MNDEIKADTFYVVSGCSPLDGLEVKGIPSLGGSLIEVQVVRKTGMLVGDRPLQISVEPGTLHIARRCLSLSKFPGKMEFASDNPFGKHEFDRKLEVDGNAIVLQAFEKATSVEVRDDDGDVVVSRTFYDQCARDTVIEFFLYLVDNTYDLTAFVDAVVGLS